MDTAEALLLLNAEAEHLLADAEAELGRPLTNSERESLVDGLLSPLMNVNSATENADMNPEEMAELLANGESVENCGGKGGTRGKCKGMGRSSSASLMSATAHKTSAGVLGRDGDHSKAAKAHQSAAKEHKAAAKEHKALAAGAGNAAVAAHHLGMAKQHKADAANHMDKASQHDQLHANDKVDDVFHTDDSGNMTGETSSPASRRAAAKSPKAKAPAKARAAASGYKGYAGQAYAAKLKASGGRPQFNSATTNEDFNMFDRDRVLDALTENCACAEDAAALNSLSDETLQGILNAKAEGSNADLTPGGGKAVQAGGEEDEGKEDRNDDEWNKDVKIKKKAPAMNWKGEDPDEDDDDDDEGDSDTEGDEDDDDDDEADNKTRGGKKGQMPPQFMKHNSRQMTMAEMIQNATPEEQEVWNNAQQVVRDQKKALVMQLISNVADPSRRKYHGNKLMGESLAQLRERLDLMPPPQRGSRSRRESPVFIGNGGGPVDNGVSGGPDTDDILPLQTLNTLDAGAKKAN